MGEFAVFGGTVWCGIIIGVLFDLFRPLHRLCRARLYHAALDVLFYAISGVFAAAGLVYLNGGTLRLYAIAGFFIGAGAYQSTLSALIRGVKQNKACQTRQYNI